MPDNEPKEREFTQKEVEEIRQMVARSNRIREAAGFPPLQMPTLKLKEEENP